MSYVLVIIEASHVESARALAEGEFGLSAEVAGKEFVPAASADAKAPATHWWLATRFPDEAFERLTQLESVVGWAHVEAYDPDTEPLRPWVILEERGLKPIGAGLLAASPGGGM